MNLVLRRRLEEVLDLCAASNAIQRAAVCEYFAKILSSNSPDGFRLTGELCLSALKLYDKTFLSSTLLSDVNPRFVTFFFSKQMYRNAGRTRKLESADRVDSRNPRYEITFSIPLVFGVQVSKDSPKFVGGRECVHRSEVFQRVFEHEMVHLCELCAWGVTNCRRDRFIRLASLLFGHTTVSHELIVSRSGARTYKLGARVGFRLGSRVMHGLLNKVMKDGEMVVLVRDENGDRYRDGNRYTKYTITEDQLLGSG